MRLRTFAHSHMRTDVHTGTETQTHTHTWIHTYVHTYHIIARVCVCMLAFTYIHTCMHAYRHTYIHISVCVCIHIYTHNLHAYVHTCILTYIDIRTCTYIHTYVRTCIHTLRMHLRTYTLHIIYAPTCIPTYLHACIPTYIQTKITYRHGDGHGQLRIYLCIVVSSCSSEPLPWLSQGSRPVNNPGLIHQRPT